jgi:hypothetical protein
MARKKQSYIKGTFTHRRTESRLHGRVAGRRAVGRLARGRERDGSSGEGRATPPHALGWRNTWWASRA